MTLDIVHQSNIYLNHRLLRQLFNILINFSAIGCAKMDLMNLNKGIFTLIGIIKLAQMFFFFCKPNCKLEWFFSFFLKFCFSFCCQIYKTENKSILYKVIILLYIKIINNVQIFICVAFILQWIVTFFFVSFGWYLLFQYISISAIIAYHYMSADKFIAKNVDFYLHFRGYYMNYRLIEFQLNEWINFFFFFAIRFPSIDTHCTNNTIGCNTSVIRWYHRKAFCLANYIYPFDASGKCQQWKIFVCIEKKKKKMEKTADISIFWMEWHFQLICNIILRFSHKLYIGFELLLFPHLIVLHTML